MDSVTALENKDYVKILGVLNQKHSTWKEHIDYNSSKIIKIIGPIARLRHHVPFKPLLEIYPSLVFPYIYCSIVAWGQVDAIKLVF